MIRFTGLFFTGEEEQKLIRLEPIRLIRCPRSFHCTFGYKPSHEDIIRFNEIVGETGTVLVDGHGQDEDNTGYRIIIPQEFREYFRNYDKNGILKVPHITMSLSDKGRAVNTCYLDFNKLVEPFEISGKFGFFIDGLNEPSYEKQKVLR